MKSLTQILAIVALLSTLATGCKPKNDGSMPRGPEIEDTTESMPMDTTQHPGDSSAVH